MELQQLKYFQMVARLGHMTRAAEALYVSQPSLSRSIARLERELGVPLFDRQGRRIRLNQYGRVLLRRVEFAFEDLERARREITDLVGPEQGVVTLLVLRGCGTHLLPPLLSAFRDHHPHTRLQLVEVAADASFSVLRQIEEGEVDVCLCPPPHEAEDVLRVTWRPVITAALSLAVPPAHRWAQRARVQLAEAASEAFIGLPAGTSLRTFTDALCQQAGFKPDIMLEVADLGTVWELVAAGAGVSLLPEWLWRAVTGTVPVQVPLEGEAPQWTIGLAWSESHYLSRACRLFRAFVMRSFAHHAAREGVPDEPAIG